MAFCISDHAEFHSAQLACRQCYHLYTDIPAALQGVHCFHCEALLDHGLYLGMSYGELDDQSRAFGAIALRRKRDSNYSARRALGDAIDIAQRLICVITYGLDFEILGALDQAARRVPVRLVVSNANPALIERVEDAVKCTPGFDARLYPNSLSSPDVPHTKLVIFDGALFGIEGSANLTRQGLQKADKKLERFNCLTVPEVTFQVHNECFPVAWRDQVEIDRLPQHPGAAVTPIRPGLQPDP